MRHFNHWQVAQQQDDTIQGYDQEVYQHLVQPNQIWPVSKYFLRHWISHLKPSEMWLIISARQLSYLNQNKSWFSAYDETLAKGAGLNVQTYRRLRRSLDGSLLGHFLQADVQNRTYTKTNGRLRSTATRYTIRLDDPLTPDHALAVAHWLKQNSPHIVTGETLNRVLQAALEAPDLLAHPSAETMIQLPEDRLFTVSDLIPHLFGEACLKSKQVWGETAVRLQYQITQPDQIHIESQYFRRQWLPQLNAGPALLLVYLRSYCYFNEQSPEQRDTVQCPRGDLEQVFGISSRTLRRWVDKIQTASDQQGSFFLAVEHHKRALQQCHTSYQLTKHIPLIPEDVEAYAQLSLSCKAEAERLDNTSLPQTVETAVFQPPTALPSVKLSNRDMDTAFYKQVDVERQPAHQPQEAWIQYAPQVANLGQKVHHRVLTYDKKVTLDAERMTKSSPQGGGYGQKDQGIWTKSSPSKDPKALIHSIKDIIYNNKQNNNKELKPSFAVVAVKNIAGLLTQLEITGQARHFFHDSHLTLAQMVGWYLWASHQPWCKQPVAYTIQRVRHNEPPPDLYEQFAELSWHEWQLYAVLCQVDLPAGVEAPSGLFELWCDHFAHTLPGQLPFGVGRGLDGVISAIQAQVNELDLGESDSAERGSQDGREMALEPEENGRFPTSLNPASSQDLTYWQQTLQELSLQITKATFGAYLQGATLVGVEANGRFVVQLRNKYAKEWVDNRLAPTILRTWSAIAGEPVQARFSL